MLITIKDTTFDEGDYGCLKIGDRRYLAYNEDADQYYILRNVDEPELATVKAITVMRRKPIAVNAPVGGSVDEIRAFAVDRPPNSVDFVLVGLLGRIPPGYAWIAGNYVGDALPLSEQEVALKGDSSKLLLPPLHFRYPKQKPSNISKKQLLVKIARETDIRTHSLLRYFGHPDPGKIHGIFHTHVFIHRDSYSDEDEQVEVDSDEDEQESDEDEQMEVEAHNLNSSSNVWSMEQLNSCLGNCATGNCSHCQELRRGVILD